MELEDESGESVATLQTIEQVFAAAPVDMIPELVSGVVMLSPRPGYASAILGLSRLLHSRDQQGRRKAGQSIDWLIRAEPELILGNDRVVPELAGWMSLHSQTSTAGPDVTGVPQWICEVLSPSTEPFDRAIKLPVYERAGVNWVWLLRFEERVIEVFRRQEGTLRSLHTIRATESVRVEPFHSIDIHLDRLWTE